MVEILHEEPGRDRNVLIDGKQGTYEKIFKKAQARGITNH
jgi:hypothetical protein